MRLSRLGILGLSCGLVLLAYACGGNHDTGSTAAGSPDASAGSNTTSLGGRGGNGSGGASTGSGGTGGLQSTGGGSGGIDQGRGGTAGDLSAAGAAGTGAEADAPLTIFSAGSKPSGIALSATDVYWADEELGTISSCPKAGCGASGPTKIATVASPRGIALHGNTLYFVTAASTDASTAPTVEECTLGACSAAQIVDVGGSVAGPFGALALATSDSLLYVTGGPTIGTCPLAGCGGNPATVLGGTFGGPHSGIAVEASGIFTARSLGSVTECPLTGCASSTDEQKLVAAPSALGIALDDTNVYWSEYQFITPSPDLDGAIRTCPKTGCQLAAAQVLTAGFIEPYALAVDDQDLLYTDHLNGKVERIPKAQSAHTCTASHLTTCCTGLTRCDDTCSVPCGEAGAGN